VGNVPVSVPGLDGSFLDFILVPLTNLLGSIPVFILALLLLLGSLKLFDKSFEEADMDTVRDRYIVYLDNRWVSFGFGLLFTVLTMSVAVTLGVVVPLYNRDISRKTR
ncbi:MAG: hypothetical protein SXQ77_02055, partial [Halobacteria archaeon]|nr:hypothetical protein [Halobacteria archaeon]